MDPFFPIVQLMMDSSASKLGGPPITLICSYSLDLFDVIVYDEHKGVSFVEIFGGNLWHKLVWASLR